MKHLKLLFSFFADRLAWTSEMTVTGVTEIDAAIPQYWAEGVMADGSRESFWSQLAGKEGSMMPLIEKTGPLKQNGDSLVFNVIAGLLGSGVTGETVLKGKEEKLGVASYTVTVDMIRHAVAVSKKSNKQANYDQVSMAGTLLKEWAARKMDFDVFNTILGSSAVTTLYANSKTALDSLNSTDGDFLSPVDLTNARLALLRQGALPLKVTKVNGRSIPVYGVVFSEIEEARLYSNTTFAQEVKDGWERFKNMNGGDHPLFRGAAGIYRNMLLYPYYSNLQLPQGSPLRPETLLYATLTTAETTTASVGDGGATVENYTLYFANSGTLQIEDEIITYTTKTTNTFGTLTRGVSSTTAAQHANNKLVTQRNVSTVIAFGAEAVCRALPEDWHPIGEKDDYGAQIGLGIEGYYGLAVKIDKRRAKAPSATMLKVYSSNPGTV